MPTASVGMRRSTRVFGVLKGVDGGGARVLRSGRRLWPDPVGNKLRRASGGDDWLLSETKKTNNSNNSGNSNSNNNKKNHNLNGDVKGKENGWGHDDAKLTRLKKQAPSRSYAKVTTSKKAKSQNFIGVTENKRFGVVYGRKRKRNGLLTQENHLRFSARQRRDSQGNNIESSFVLAAAVDEGCWHGCGTEFSCFLSLVLGYLKRGSLTLSELAAFLFSDPVSTAFASTGIRFLRDCSSYRTGICKFFESGQFIPLFTVDFSAVPFCFIHMHLSLVLRVGILSLVPVNNSLNEDTLDEVSDSEEDHVCVSMKIENDDRITTVHEEYSSGGKVVPQTSIRSSRLAGRHAQFRNGLNSRGIQKRRSSLRRRRAGNPSHVGMRKANGALVTDSISSSKNGKPLVSVACKTKLRRSVHEHSAADIKDVGSSAVGVAQDIGLSSCNANILVIESDRCYRIEGATITLDFSGSGDWMLVMKKDGFTRYTHLAQKNMRPCTANRITHDFIWSGDESWKLEFPNRHDWVIFKDLYKECSDRNLVASGSKAIPVPGVHEVLGYEDITGATFTRTDAYISLKNDEVARAFAKRTANYDMDSEDEEWLKKFNSEFCLETKQHDHLSEDNFELMIDAFEKALYCSPDDFPDDKAAVNLCMEFGRREVIEAVYGYWMEKRKQRRTALLRVFQGHQAKKAPLIPKPVLRKRRSLKRQCSQFGRGKQPTVLRVMAAEQGALEEQSAMLKVEQAKISAKKSAELAIVKRHSAQLLMENADLATYKAVMALRIAKAACIANPLAAAVCDLLD